MNNVSTLNFPIIRPLVVRWEFNAKFFWILSLIVVSLLVVLYIFQINQVTGANFLISETEQQIVQFSQKSKTLETDLSYSNSLNSLEAVLGRLNYEKVGKIHYLRVSGATVVAK